MKINCIGFENTKHIQTDMETLRFLCKKGKDKLELQTLNGNHYKTTPASINLFINMINPIFFHSAKVNLVLIDPSEFSQNYVPFLKDVDGILVKTPYALEVMRTCLIQSNLFESSKEVDEKLHLVL